MNSLSLKTIIELSTQLRDAKVVTSAADAGSVSKLELPRGGLGRGMLYLRQFVLVEVCGLKCLKSDKAVYFCGHLLNEALDADFTWFCLI